MRTQPARHNHHPTRADKKPLSISRPVMAYHRPRFDNITAIDDHPAQTRPAPNPGKADDDAILDLGPVIDKHLAPHYRAPQRRIANQPPPSRLSSIRPPRILATGPL